MTFQYPAQWWVVSPAHDYPPFLSSGNIVKDQLLARSQERQSRYVAFLNVTTGELRWLQYEKSLLFMPYHRLAWKIRSEGLKSPFTALPGADSARDRHKNNRPPNIQPILEF